MPDEVGEEDVMYGQSPDYFPFNRDKDFLDDE
jgi:hypothetical protein